MPPYIAKFFNRGWDERILTEYQLLQITPHNDSKLFAIRQQGEAA